MQPIQVASDLSGVLLSFIEANAIHAPELTSSILASSKKDRRIDYQYWCNYLCELKAITNNPLLGIELGLSVQPHHCGVLGYLSLNCEYLSEALMGFERYQRLLYGGSSGEVSMANNKLRFTWPESVNSLGIALSDEVLIFGLIGFSKKLIGDQSIHGIKVGFSHEPLAPVLSYTNVIENSAFEFGVSRLYAEFPIDFLDLKTSNNDPALLALLEQQAETLLSVLPDDSEFESQLKSQLLTILQEGEPTLERLSNALCLSPRTLHRRLADRGYNFAALLKKTRTELAMQYLEEKKLSLNEIAFLLGYSEQSAFSRAFKSWTGETPKGFIKDRGI